VERNRAGKFLARKSFAVERRREMSVIARQISGNVCACRRQRPADAVRERTDTKNHRCGLGLLNFARHKNFRSQFSLKIFHNAMESGGL